MEFGLRLRSHKFGFFFLFFLKSLSHYHGILQLISKTFRATQKCFFFFNLYYYFLRLSDLWRIKPLIFKDISSRVLQTLFLKNIRYRELWVETCRFIKRIFQTLSSHNRRFFTFVNFRNFFFQEILVVDFKDIFFKDNLPVDFWIFLAF